MSYASVCVLSYERPKLLADTLLSLRSCAGAPLEVIVHDDGSCDAQLQAFLLGELNAGRVSRLILNPPGHNEGQGTALNRMFNMASGDPIIKCDQDLIFEPNWLRRTNEILNRAPRIGLLGLLHYHHDPVDSAKTKIKQFDGWSSRTHILGSAFAVTRECWEALGPFEEHYDSFGEDWNYQLRVAGSDTFCCALPDEDLCINVGMGYGPSTVNVEPGKVQSIHHGPLVLE